MPTPTQIVEMFMADFIAAWPAQDAARLTAYFSADAIYHNMPLEPVQGHDAIQATLAGFMAMAGEARVDMLHLLADDEIVMTERVDHFVRPDLTISLPVMGIFEVREGLITAWRDYFDLSKFSS